MTEKEIEAKINLTIGPLDRVLGDFQRVVRAAWPKDHPDATLLDEAHANMPVKPNFNAPSLPVTK
jgi:hypothetical protein